MDPVQEARRMGQAAGRVRRDLGAARQRDRQTARPAPGNAGPPQVSWTPRATKGPLRGPWGRRRTSSAWGRSRGRPHRSDCADSSACRPARRRARRAAGNPCAATRHAGEQRAGARHMGLRSQVRRLPPAGAHRQRPCAPVHSQRQRLDRQAVAACRRDRVAGPAISVARRRNRRAERCRHARLQRPAERFRCRRHRLDHLLRFRPAAPERVRPSAHAAARPARPARATAQCVERRTNPLQRELCRGSCERPGVGAHIGARRNRRETQRRALLFATLQHVAETEVPSSAGVRDRRLHRPRRFEHRGGQPDARRARRRGPAPVRRQRGHRLERGDRGASAQPPRADRDRHEPVCRADRTQPLVKTSRGRRALGRADAGRGSPVPRLDTRRACAPRVVSGLAHRQAGARSGPRGWRNRRGRNARNTCGGPGGRACGRCQGVARRARHRHVERPDQTRPRALLRKRRAVDAAASEGPAGDAGARAARRGRRAVLPEVRRGIEHPGLARTRSQTLA